MGIGLKRFSIRALEVLKQRSWPGNVRELQNVIESGLILSGGKSVQPEHIADRLIPSLSFRGSEASRGISPGQPAGATLAEVERNHLEAALTKTGGNQSQAARLLGISRATLIYRTKKYGLF